MREHCPNDQLSLREMRMNCQSFGRALSELFPHHNAIPRLAYYVNFAKRRIKDRGVNFGEGFSLVVATLNRKEFLSCAVTAVVSNTQLPFELIIMDNASNDGTARCAKPWRKNIQALSVMCDSSGTTVQTRTPLAFCRRGINTWLTWMTMSWPCRRVGTDRRSTPSADFRALAFS